jgi:hypothetical protein
MHILGEFKVRMHPKKTTGLGFFLNPGFSNPGRKGLQAFMIESYAEIYRDYPATIPFSLVLRKEYFDFPQRDPHAVHYI